MTEAEKKLWSLLRDKQLDVKFRRQFPFGKSILDFYCHQARIDVEADGGQHYTAVGIVQDEERDAELEQQGIKVLRYSNTQVLEETETVAEEIFDEVQKRIRGEAEGSNNGN